MLEYNRTSLEYVKKIKNRQPRICLSYKNVFQNDNKIKTSIHTQIEYAKIHLYEITKLTEVFFQKISIIFNFY